MDADCSPVDGVIVADWASRSSDADSAHSQMLATRCFTVVAATALALALLADAGGSNKRWRAYADDDEGGGKKNSEETEADEFINIIILSFGGR